MSLLKKLFNYGKKEKIKTNDAHKSKQSTNLKILTKNIKEDKSPITQIRKNKNMPETNNNNNKCIIQNLQEQCIQTRDRSKKAKNKIKNQSNGKIIKIAKTNIKTILNKESSDDNTSNNNNNTNSNPYTKTNEIINDKNNNNTNFKANINTKNNNNINSNTNVNTKINNNTNNNTNIKIHNNINNNTNNSIIINTDTKTNYSKDNVDKVENLLKSKIQSINPNVKDNTNFLKVSVSDLELFNINNNLQKKEDNNIENCEDKKIINDIINDINSKAVKQTKIKMENFFNEEKQEKNEDKNKDKNKSNTKKKEILQSYNTKGIKSSAIMTQRIDIKKSSIFNLDKKKFINEKNEIFEEKEANINMNKKNLSNILVPLTNLRKENNCFLNVLIQIISNLEDFRDSLLKIFNESCENEAVKELCKLIGSYKNTQIKYKDIESPNIEPILSVNLLRNNLNNIYGNYGKGEVGDPMETLEYLLDLIHKEYLRKYPTKEDDICHCPSHHFFFLFLSEIISCNICKKQLMNTYNQNCFIFNIFVPEIINKINEKKEDFNSYKLKLFSKIKEQSDFNEDEKKIKIKDCQCSELQYSKKLKLIVSNNPYLIINITWAEEFPNMKNILTIFCLLSFTDKYSHLFDIEQKENKQLYIKSIVLYGIYHYVCVIYMNDQKKWGIIDDKTIKYIEKYPDLVNYLLRNHLMPVGVVYSWKKKDKIDKNEIESNFILNEEYLRLYRFCEEVENNRNLHIDSIAPNKGSFNETNENYLDNNLFYKSLINIVNSSSDSDYEEYKNKLKEKNLLDNKNNSNENKNNENKNNENKNNKNNSNENNNENNNTENNIQEKKVNFDEIKSGRFFMGDFKENDLRGGFIVLSTSYEEEDQKDNTINDKDKEKMDDSLGKNYIEKNK